MKILHSSDWHIGRTFHGHSTLEHLSVVLSGLVALVREHDVDVVAVAGDIFDSAQPSADCFAVLSTVLRDLHDAGASVVITSGNHDSAARLGFHSEWLGLSGIHIITAHDAYSTPVTIDDEYGPVSFYGIPYLEPSLFRHRHPQADLHTHEQVLGFAMDGIRADAAGRETRSVVLSHCFAAGIGAGANLASDEASDVEQDITSGGLNVVPVGVFDGPDYVALGHIHGRAAISERVRYSGAPLHYSFGEAPKPRGVWLVELDAGGLDTVHWLDLPVPRRLSVLTGTLEELLVDPEYSEFESDWVEAILTDRVRPLDAMRLLQQRFPHCAHLEHRPLVQAETTGVSYRQRIAAKSDDEIVAGFLELVRNGVGPTEYEAALIAEVVAAQAVTEAGA